MQKRQYSGSKTATGYIAQLYTSVYSYVRYVLVRYLLEKVNELSKPFFGLTFGKSSRIATEFSDFATNFCVLCENLNITFLEILVLGEKKLGFLHKFSVMKVFLKNSLNFPENRSTHLKNLYKTTFLPLCTTISFQKCHSTPNCYETATNLYENINGCDV